MARKPWLSVAQAQQEILNRPSPDTPVQQVRPSMWEIMGQAYADDLERQRLAAEQFAGGVKAVAAGLGKLGGYKDAYHAVSEGKNQIGHNDFRDAMRHAETSRRVSNAVGEAPAYALGTLRELWEAYVKRYPADEMVMDLHNNAEGRRAAHEGRPVDARRLQTSPGGSRPSGKDFRYR